MSRTALRDSRSEPEAEEALRVAVEVLGGLGVELHPGTTRIVDLRKGR
jgi:hypothetical protein